MRINMRGGRLYITMVSGNAKVTMALSPEEALAIASYLQAKANVLIARGAYIGVRRSSRAGGSRAGEEAPRQVDEDSTAGEDVGEE